MSLPFGTNALVGVPTRHLEQLLAMLYRKQLVLPLTHPTLLEAGLPHLVDKVGFLHGLDHDALRAVLVAVIAERRAQTPR
jgi:hypothetical protein